MKRVIFLFLIIFLTACTGIPEPSCHPVQAQIESTEVYWNGKMFVLVEDVEEGVTVKDIVGALPENGMITISHCTSYGSKYYYTYP